MLARLLATLDATLPHTPILVAVSGGIDSMLLATLIVAAKREMAVAHCNFGLRDTESDEDEAFVRAWATQQGVRCFVTRFDTAAVVADRKQSIQVVARDLRYAWLELLRVQHGFGHIATAHHANDNLETVIFNLSRGASLRGLAGIPPQTDTLLRPLLAVAKADIVAAAKAAKIAWRNDSSNATNKYNRNKIRHQIVPKLEELNPNIAHTVAQNSLHLRHSIWLYDYAVTALQAQYMTVAENAVTVDINALKQLPVADTLLYEWIHQYGFGKTQIADILQVSESGKRFLTENYTAVWRKGILLIMPK